MIKTFLFIWMITFHAEAQDTIPRDQQAVMCGAAMSFIKGDWGGEKAEALGIDHLVLPNRDTPQSTLDLYTRQHTYHIEKLTDGETQTEFTARELDSGMFISRRRDQLTLVPKNKNTRYKIIPVDPAQAQIYLKSETLRLICEIPESLKNELAEKIKTSEPEAEINRWKQDIMLQFIEQATACTALMDYEIQTALEISLAQTKEVLN